MNIHKYHKISVIGEMLFDVYEDKKMLGGAPLNFALNLIYLGTTEIDFYSSIGNDSLGEHIISYCQEKFSTENILIYNKETDQVKVTKNESENYFKINEHSLFDLIEFDCDQSIVYFGSLAMRGEENREKLKAIARNDNYFICDMNLREPYYNTDIIEILLDITNILKINNEELHCISELFNIKSTQKTIEFFLVKFNIDIVVLTNGSEGGDIYFRDNKIHYTAKKIDVISTVGAGDSFFAGFIHEILKGSSIEKSAVCGAEISALVCQQDSPFLTKKNKKQNSIGKNIF